jgi:hypothetical protein
LLFAFLVLPFEGIDAKHGIGRAETYGRRDQCDCRYNQRGGTPCHADGCDQPDNQQNYTDNDATGTIDSAYIAFHDDLLSRHCDACSPQAKAAASRLPKVLHSPVVSLDPG